MEIKIRKIEKKDINQACQFCIGIFEELGWDERFIYGLKNLKGFFSGPKEVFFIAKKGKEIIACAGIKRLSDKEALIKRFYVAKDFRGKGLADLMLEKIKEFAKEKNYKSIVVDIFQNNLRAKRFFQRRDFLTFSPDVDENWIESQHPKTFEFRKIEL